MDGFFLQCTELYWCTHMVGGWVDSSVHRRRMWPITQKTLDKLRVVTPVLQFPSLYTDWHAWEWRPNVDIHKTVIMVCPSCCCGIYSRIFIVSSCGWCLTSSTYRGRSTDICRPLVYLQSPRSENRWRKKNSYGNTSSLLPFRGPVVGGGTFSRLLVAAITDRSWKKSGHVTLFYCSWGSVWYFSCFGVVVDTSWRKPPPLTNTACTIYTFWHHILPH